MRQLTVFAAAVVALAALNAAPAWAQATTTFVSGDGVDTNPCTHALPCRSFRHAHDQTTVGGQITMLDPAGYGAVTIIKAISIVNDGGGEAGITEPGEGVDAVTINAGASDVVTLRGLTLNGVGRGRNGINFNSGGTLNIQDCVIRGFVNDGVLVAPAAEAAVTIADTIVSNNGNDGVHFSPVSGRTAASLERVTAIGNGNGIFVSPASGSAATIQGTIADSAAISNVGLGFFLASGAAAATLALVNSQAIGNDIGVNTGTGMIVMSRVTLAGNAAFGFATLSLKSFGDNYIINTNNSGGLTPIGLQ